VESVNLGLELRKRVTHNFSTLRSRSLRYKQDLISQVRGRLTPVSVYCKILAVVAVVFASDTWKFCQRDSEGASR